VVSSLTKYAANEGDSPRAWWCESAAPGRRFLPPPDCRQAPKPVTARLGAASAAQIGASAAVLKNPRQRAAVVAFLEKHPGVEGRVLGAAPGVPGKLPADRPGPPAPWAA